MTARVLYLPLKAEYFDAIVSGAKKLEFREANPYWVKRLDGRTFDVIEITKGYPARGDKIRRNRRVWRGYVRDTITHEHFGPDPVDVFAIDVSVPAACRKCGGAMRPGKATGQTLTGIGDFHDNDTVCTLSPGGPGELIDCYKCEACGWSVT